MATPQALEIETASKDVVVSALVLNFVPDKEKALAEMKRVTRPGGTVAFYVWDYRGGGVEFIRAFWTAATKLDANARDLTEDKRFPFCTPDQLLGLTRQAGFSTADHLQIEAPAVFRATIGDLSR